MEPNCAIEIERVTKQNVRNMKTVTVLIHYLANNPLLMKTIHSFFTFRWEDFIENVEQVIISLQNLDVEFDILVFGEVWLTRPGQVNLSLSTYSYCKKL